PVDRGRSYYATGSVRDVRADRHSVRATVRGGDDYSVLLLRDGPALVVWCTCPYVDTVGMPCKHIVATILHAEARRLDPVSGAISRVDIIDDDLPEEEYEHEYDIDDVFDDDEEEEEEEEPMYTSPPRRRRGRPRGSRNRIPYRAAPPKPLKPP